MQDASRLEKSKTHTGSPFHHDSKQEIWRIIKPIAQARRVRTKRTVASLVLGQGSVAEAHLFQWGARDGLPLRTLWVTWYVGLVAGFLALVEAVPSYCVWAATLMVPLPLVTSALLSKDLVLEILCELDFYLIQILHAVGLSHGLIHTWHDERRVFWFLYLPSLIVAPLVDAYPAKYRPRFLQLYFVGMLCILVGWNVFELHERSLHHFTYVVGDLATLSLFYVRQIYAATWHKDNFVLISCAMYTALERVDLSTGGSGLQPEPQTVRVAPPRSYSFNEKTHSLSDWQREQSPGGEAEETTRLTKRRATAPPLRGPLAEGGGSGDPYSDASSSSSEPEGIFADGIFGSFSNWEVSAGLVPTRSASQEVGAPPGPDGSRSSGVGERQRRLSLASVEENEEAEAAAAASPSASRSGGGAEGAGPARAEV